MDLLIWIMGKLNLITFRFILQISSHLKKYYYTDYPMNYGKNSREEKHICLGGGVLHTLQEPIPRMQNVLKIKYMACKSNHTI